MAEAERSIEVFQAGADALEARLAAEGWRYARSGPHATRPNGRFRARLDFGTSVHNRRGEYAELRVSAGIRDRGKFTAGGDLTNVARPAHDHGLAV